MSYELKCIRCNVTGEPRVEKTALHHKAYCQNCGRFIKHIPKSILDGPKKANGKRRKNQWTPSNIGKDYCEVCGRPSAQLGDKERLEAHHKVPIEDGGDDSRDNILIACTPCHKMAHFLRTYLNKHLSHLHESGVNNDVQFG